jgi:hypothetical protein
MNPSKTKAAILGFGAALVGMAGVITVYIPFYSSFEPAKTRRDEYLGSGVILAPPQVAANKAEEKGATPAKHGGEPIRRPGSMYENMNRNVKGQRKLAENGALVQEDEAGKSVKEL